MEEVGYERFSKEALIHLVMHQEQELIKVLPAHAGVILKEVDYERFSKGITRTCGGDP